MIEAEPGRPNRPDAARSQRAARHLADDPSQWSRESARQVVDEYRHLARTWDSERGSYRPVPLRDALARGGPFPTGPCLEVGAGTGLLTEILRTTWPQVVSVDLSPEMLHRSRAPWRVRCDASILPLSGRSMAAVLVADAPLFAAELVRVLRPDGVIVWTNALGDAAPHHLPCDVVLEALARTDAAGDWTAVTSVAGWGSWAVFRRGREASDD